MSLPLPTRIVAPRPEPTHRFSQQSDPTLFSQRFSPVAPQPPDPPSSSPPLILPRAEHSSPCSNTASPAGWKFSSLRLFNFHSLACAALRSPALPTSGMLRRFFSLSLSPKISAAGGRREWCIVHRCWLPGEPLDGSKQLRFVWRNRSQLDALGESFLTSAVCFYVFLKSSRYGGMRTRAIS